MGDYDFLQGQRRYDYVIPRVTSGEFAALKDQERGIIAEATSRFNDSWAGKVAGLNVTIRYNAKRLSVGVFVGQSGHENLVLDSEDCGGFEVAVAAGVCGVLEERLDRLRIPNELWQD